MEYVITEFLDIIIEILLLYIFFRPTKSRIRKYTCVFFISLLLAFLYLFSEKGMLAFIDIVINILLIIFLLEETWREKIFSFLFIYVIMTPIYQGFVLLYSSIWHLPILGGISNVMEESPFKFIIIIFLFILLMFKIKKKYCFCLSLVNKLFLSIFSISVSLCLVLLQTYSYVLDNSYLRLFTFIFIIAITAIIFYLVSVSEKNREITKNNIQSKYISILKAYYAEIEKNELELWKVKHDMKNHIHTLTGLMASLDYERAKNYLQQINEYAISKIDSVPSTGNLLLNAILLEKACEFTDVKVNFKGALKADISIQDYDFTAIISNLLDNALEYSRLHQFPDITLCIYQEPSILLIALSNQIDGYINTKRFGKHSTKPERGHGYGISNVKEVLRKYHGHLQYTQEKGLLTVTAQLFLK